ncbi:MAG TPA: hypothetical protein PLG04_08455, partial [Anaerolineaceae bacterium]|nr:hypothetical protein [Anaerolineaceae bacterium]
PHGGTISQSRSGAKRLAWLARVFYPQICTDDADFWGSAKALLGCFTRRREDAKIGGRVSPRAAFRAVRGAGI